jgi:hypothetical protein
MNTYIGSPSHLPQLTFRAIPGEKAAPIVRIWVIAFCYKGKRQEKTGVITYVT